MTLLNPAILFGLGLVAVPVILHLLLRQKPKKLVFPAMRLIEKRRKQNVRRLRLRHLWLLLLRMLVIALLVFAIARPSLPAADYGLSPRELITLVGVIAAVVATYFFMITRWRKQLARYEYAYRRSMLRGWMTGLTLLLLMMLVGWPYQRRIAAEIKAPPTDVDLDLPVAAVFLFDTSLSMEYLQGGQSRLDVAKDLAQEHLTTFPGGSRVAIADVSNDNPVLFQSTLGGAKSRIDALKTAPMRIPVNDRLRDALRAQKQDREVIQAEFSSGSDAARQDRYLRRIYVFTDLAGTAWRTGGASLLRAEIEKQTDMPVFLIDVGELQPQNVAVSGLSLSANRVPLGGSLVVSATVEAEGAVDGTRMLEFTFHDGGRAPVPHDKMEVVLEPGTAQRLEFRMLSGLTGPVVHGDVRVVGSDPLEFDDVRYFTVDVGAPTKVLIVAPDAEEADEWRFTLNPSERDDTGGARFALVVTPADRLPQVELEQYDVICLLNLHQVGDEMWYKLGQYVDGGGGLAVFLGDDETRINPVSYNRGQAQAFLPAELFACMPRNREGWHLNLDPISHPVYANIRRLENYQAQAVLENEALIYKFWKVTPAESAAVLATFTDSDRSPAILERLHGKGRVLMFTTAVDLKTQSKRWNTLPVLVNWFAWKALADRMVDYLARTSDYDYTYDVGEQPLLELEPADEDRQFLFRRPDLTQERWDVAAGVSEALPPESTAIGHYDIAASGNAVPIAGFSMNPPPAESDLTRLSKDKLDELLGEDKYQVARDISQLKSEIDISNFGKEVFPIVLLIAVIAFCGEHLVANRFYDLETDAGGASGPDPSTTTAARPEPSTADSALSESTATTS